jgi:hypothetical protein
MPIKRLPEQVSISSAGTVSKTAFPWRFADSQTSCQNAVLIARDSSTDQRLDHQIRRRFTSATISSCRKTPTPILLPQRNFPLVLLPLRQSTKRCRPQAKDVPHRWRGSRCRMNSYRRATSFRSAALLPQWNQRHADPLLPDGLAASRRISLRNPRLSTRGPNAGAARAISRLGSNPVWRRTIRPLRNIFRHVSRLARDANDLPANSACSTARAVDFDEVQHGRTTGTRDSGVVARTDRSAAAQKDGSAE